MTDTQARGRGDQAKVSVRVAVDVATAFEVFTQEMDLWWRQGPRYRIAGKTPGRLTLEPRPGGRLLEAYTLESGPQLFERGRIKVWEPPTRLVFDWRNMNFAPGESTEVEVQFEPSGQGTLVTVCHRGWTGIPPGHPVRHGMEVPEFLRMMGLWWSDLMSAMREYVATRGTDARS